MKVFALVSDAMNVRHPVGGFLDPERGGEWPDDGLTFRMIRDGELTTDERKAWRPEKKAAEVAPRVDHLPVDDEPPVTPLPDSR